MTHHVIQFSGGIGSALTAVRVAEQRGTQNMVLLIADTRAEDPDLWRFSDDIARLLGLRLTVVRDGRDPWEVFADQRFLGNDRLAPCTFVLKQKPCRRWMSEHAPPGETIAYVGIEPNDRDRRRIPAIARNWHPWRTEFPLADGPDATKGELLDEVRALGVRPPRLYELGFPHNNCFGSCVRAGQRQWKHLLTTLPERYAHAETKEEELRGLLGDVAILRDRRGGTSRPLPLAELRTRQQTAV
ncbi:phosphoadenosine phosphosulfate reductase domain-containing protein [Streptomyces yaizuensis]|uniref:Phosphoadenosine phosphosulfate reductase family protein n=1 Tax=Streptomyces yaizuensis TaxID=2989713 RepID=A0ABQ5P7R5_9ACTN|nr:phosphoadenosine phosphosulfate reductase family protein [Streptomyces sp. YSPA8]GLF98271.1 phosphoadenosine phosphosulfate reductase family protein [Streptomyces sp. YSPA8]